jgi:sRNA-binding protein
LLAALVTDGQPQLLAVNIREAMVNDIRRRGLEVSVKTLKRCLAAVTRSDAYLGAMTVGAWRKNLAGEPVAPVSGGGGVCRGAQGSGAC